MAALHESAAMREMTIAKLLVAEAVERLGAGGDRVTDVEIVLGCAARLSAESVCRQFDVAARGTPAEGAAVHVTLDSSRYWCFDCMFEFSSRAHRAACPRCGGGVLSLDREQLAYVRSIGAGVR
jgi:hydrogenase nickel incorporation protein HypA/HybF